MYTKTNWVARVGTALNRFLKTNETSTEVELTNDPTGVTTAGTPFTVANMNKIEQGIYDNSVHAESDGKDHSDVVLNNSHRVNTSNPHSVTKEQITGLKSTDSPTFASVNTTNGPNKPVDNNDASMPSVGIGGFSYAHHSVTVSAQFPSITIGSGGTWVYIAHSKRDTFTSVQIGRISGGSSVQGQFAANQSYDAFVQVIAWRIA